MTSNGIPLGKNKKNLVTSVCFGTSVRFGTRELTNCIIVYWFKGYCHVETTGYRRGVSV